MTTGSSARDLPVPEPDDGGEPRISYVVARLERAIRRAINERVGAHGLTVLQYTTLSILGYRGELSNAQLARRAYMSPQAMSEVIEALEGKGLIERAPRLVTGASCPRCSRRRAGRCCARATRRSTSSRPRCSAAWGGGIGVAPGRPRLGGAGARRGAARALGTCRLYQVT